MIQVRRWLLSCLILIAGIVLAGGATRLTGSDYRWWIGDRSWAASRPSRQQLGMPHLMRINKAQNSKKSITT